MLELVESLLRLTQMLNNAPDIVIVTLVYFDVLGVRPV